MLKQQLPQFTINSLIPYMLLLPMHCSLQHFGRLSRSERVHLIVCSTIKLFMVSTCYEHTQVPSLM